MALFEFIKDRKRKAVLFFLTGFFSGGILYFLCNDAAADLYEELWQNIKNWIFCIRCGSAEKWRLSFF